MGVEKTLKGADPWCCHSPSVHAGPGLCFSSQPRYLFRVFSCRIPASLMAAVVPHLPGCRESRWLSGLNSSALSVVTGGSWRDHVVQSQQRSCVIWNAELCDCREAAIAGALVCKRLHVKIPMIPFTTTEAWPLQPGQPRQPRAFAVSFHALSLQRLAASRRMLSTQGCLHENLSAVSADGEWYIVHSNFDFPNWEFF